MLLILILLAQKPSLGRTKVLETQLRFCCDCGLTLYHAEKNDCNLQHDACLSDFGGDWAFAHCLSGNRHPEARAKPNPRQRIVVLAIAPLLAYL